MLAEAENEEQTARTTLEPELLHFQSEIKLIELKLDRLLTLQLEGDLNIAEYRNQKNKLINKKIEHVESLSNLQKTGNNWLEPVKEFLLDTSFALR